MVYLIILIFLVVILFLLLMILKKRKCRQAGTGVVGQKMREKKENKEKILKFLQSREKITNDNVERFLGVSNATAERYLDELEKEGFIRQVGRTGQAVYYEKR